MLTSPRPSSGTSDPRSRRKIRPSERRTLAGAQRRGPARSRRLSIVEPLTDAGRSSVGAVLSRKAAPGSSAEDGPSVDVDHLPIDPRTLFGQQEGNQRCDIAGLPHPRTANAPQRAGFEFAPLRGGADRLGGGEARSDRVAADTFFAPA